MRSQDLRWLNCIEGTGRRLRLSRELDARSRQSLCRSWDLVLQSRILLAQEQQIGPAAPSVQAPLEARDEEPPAHVPAPLRRGSRHASEGLELVADRSIEGEVVSMDGKHFVDCELLNCTLQYSGQPVIVESTRFKRCGFQFSGEAAMTARFLECFQLLPEETVEYASSPFISGSTRPN